jgi:hypothetical protein
VPVATGETGSTRDEWLNGYPIANRDHARIANRQLFDDATKFMALDLWICDVGVVPGIEMVVRSTEAYRFHPD